MNITPEVVASERAWLLDRSERTVASINDVRETLGDAFGASVDSVTPAQYESEVRTVFENGDLAVNVAALVGVLRDLDVEDDYPGFVVDEYLGRRLAATIAGEEPLSLLAEATFHVADVRMHGDDSEAAGMDDLEAALVAGFQTRLPGWEWQDGAGPFDRTR